MALGLSACKKEQKSPPPSEPVPQAIDTKSQPLEQPAALEPTQVQELPSTDIQTTQTHDLAQERQNTEPAIQEDEAETNMIQKAPAKGKEQFLGIRKVVMQGDGSALITASLSEMISDDEEDNDYRIVTGEVVKLKAGADLQVEYPIEVGLPHLKSIGLRDFAVKCNAYIHDYELDEDYYNATIDNGVITSLSHQYLP